MRRAGFLACLLLVLAGCGQAAPDAAGTLVRQGIEAYRDGDDAGLADAIGALEATDTGPGAPSTLRREALNAASALGALRGVLLLGMPPATRFAYAARLCDDSSWADRTFTDKERPALCPSVDNVLLRWRLWLLVTNPMGIVHGNFHLDAMGLLMASPHRQAGFTTGETVELSPLTQN